LLKIDLEKYRGNSDALLQISVNLQKLGTEQKSEIQRLQAEKTSNPIIKPPSTGSRRRTDESHSSQATTMSVDNDETVVVFSASDNELTVRQRRSMKGTAFLSFYQYRLIILLPDTDYIQAELPAFHWWSDRLHIYFERPSDSSLYETPQVVVVKDEIEESSGRDVKLIRTVRLAKLGIRIRVRRMLGQIKFIYVLSPRPQATHIKETAAQNGHTATFDKDQVSNLIFLCWVGSFARGGIGPGFFDLMISRPHIGHHVSHNTQHVFQAGAGSSPAWTGFVMHFPMSFKIPNETMTYIRWESPQGV
jgi:hypothetical protein